MIVIVRATAMMTGLLRRWRVARGEVLCSSWLR